MLCRLKLLLFQERWILCHPNSNPNQLYNVIYVVELMLVSSAKLEIHLLHQMLSKQIMFQISKNLNITHIRTPTIQVGEIIQICHGEITKGDSNRHHLPTNPKRRNKQIWKEFWESSLRSQEQISEIKRQSTRTSKTNWGSFQSRLQKGLKDRCLVTQ